MKEFVITPDDELIAQSTTSKKIAATTTKFENWHPHSIEELAAEMASLPHEALKQFIELTEEEKVGFLENARTGNFINNNNNIHNTVYHFSELGKITVDDFINQLNVLRVFFEGKTGETLEPESKQLLIDYAKVYYNIDCGGLSEADAREKYEKTAIEIFASDNFKLKDSIFNQQFLNTLGKKMLISLAKINNDNINHQDVKPDNIVLVQDKQKNIAVKLIDIDLLKPESGLRKQPSVGCISFMPPEALLNERDGSVSYSGKKGDAFAMGLTLRKSLGFSQAEIVGVSKLLKIEAAADTKNIDDSNLAHEAIQQMIESAGLRADSEIKNQLYVKALAKGVPQALSLKEISDLMLKRHPGKRFSAQEALTEFPFFDDVNNILSDHDFSDHVLRLGRYGHLVKVADLARVNNSSDESIKKLGRLRNMSHAARIRARQQLVDGPRGSILSTAEAAKVRDAERVLQAQAAFRRLGRSLGSLFGEDRDIGEQKLQYKKR